MKPQSLENSGETYSAAPVRPSGGAAGYLCPLPCNQDLGYYSAICLMSSSRFIGTQLFD